MIPTSIIGLDVTKTRGSSRSFKSNYTNVKIQVRQSIADTFAKRLLHMEAIMFKLFVYYHDILRYTIFGDFEKIQELRSQGFYVEVKAVPSQH